MNPLSFFCSNIFNRQLLRLCFLIILQATRIQSQNFKKSINLIEHNNLLDISHTRLHSIDLKDTIAVVSLQQKSLRQLTNNGTITISNSNQSPFVSNFLIVIGVAGGLALIFIIVTATICICCSQYPPEPDKEVEYVRNTLTRESQASPRSPRRESKYRDSYTGNPGGIKTPEETMEDKNNDVVYTTNPRLSRKVASPEVEMAKSSNNNNNNNNNNKQYNPSIRIALPVVPVEGERRTFLSRFSFRKAAEKTPTEPASPPSLEPTLSSDKLLTRNRPVVGGGRRRSSVAKFTGDGDMDLAAKAVQQEEAARKSPARMVIDSASPSPSSPVTRRMSKAAIQRRMSGSKPSSADKTSSYQSTSSGDGSPSSSAPSKNSGSGPPPPPPSRNSGSGPPPPPPPPSKETSNGPSGGGPPPPPPKVGVISPAPPLSSRKQSFRDAPRSPGKRKESMPGDFI